MPEYRFIQVDVFTDQVFGGNPLAVFPDADGLDTAQMQAIAREMNLSETTFVTPATQTDAEYERLHAEGAALTFHEAVAYALAEDEASEE